MSFSFHSMEVCPPAPDSSTWWRALGWFYIRSSFFFFLFTISIYNQINCHEIWSILNAASPARTRLLEAICLLSELQRLQWILNQSINSLFLTGNTPGTMTTWRNVFTSFRVCEKVSYNHTFLRKKMSSFIFDWIVEHWYWDGFLLTCQ